MHKLLRVSKDPEADAVYLVYSDDAPVRQRRLDDHSMLNVDYADDGSIVGIEMLSPDNDEMEKLVQFARDNDLSLEGLFVA